MKISSVVLWVQENQLSEKFYKKLGFEVLASDETRTTVSLSGFEIMLVNMRDDSLFARDVFAAEKGRGFYLYVAVEDVDKYYQQLHGRGITPHTEPTDWEWGNREFIVKDPDGYKFCFWQKIKQ